MRSFMFSFAAVSLLFLPACNIQSSTPEAEIAPVDATPIPGSAPTPVTDEVATSDEPAADDPMAEPKLTLDPAPTPPPTDSEPALQEESLSTERSSAEDTFQSVARVLRNAVAGETDEAEAHSNGSVYGSIGRALSKGFQEAAARENTSDE
ncbi:MAG: hypothetical protein WD070_06605 [Pirellulaceae bacterium]